MSGGHHSTDSLHTPLDTRVHSIDATVKLVCLCGFLLAVVATPSRAVPAFSAYALLVAVAAVGARLPLKVLGRRLLIEIPFVVFALALPFTGSGPEREILGVSVSINGCWTAWSILAKATLGTAATVVLAWSTRVPDILHGLERLRCPRVITAIAAFMIRYLDVIVGQLHRLQVARLSRCDNPLWLWQGRAVAATAGTLFVRSFERGERVHRAMLARGFTGRLPTALTGREPLSWFPAAAWPCAAWAVALVAIMR
ncbi:MAG: Energy-coupling factor transporter transmembrane protein EcfT [Acidimicrobiales bacterium]|nr:Energy-coupling factor transporter transmembrane protein EcfT [Acidimicrobiales bacterium]